MLGMMPLSYFDVSVYAIAAGSYYLPTSGHRWIHPFASGVQAFAICSVFDKALTATFGRYFPDPKVQPLQEFVLETFTVSVSTGMLTTRSESEIIPRFLATTMLAAFATSTVINQWHMKLGIICGIVRECLLVATPGAYQPLALLDGCIFALITAGKKEEGNIELSRWRLLPVFSSDIFRAFVMHGLAKRHGFFSTSTLLLFGGLSSWFESRDSRL